MFLSGFVVGLLIGLLVMFMCISMGKAAAREVSVDATKFWAENETNRTRSTPLPFVVRKANRE